MSVEGYGRAVGQQFGRIAGDLRGEPHVDDLIRTESNGALLHPSERQFAGLGEHGRAALEFTADDVLQPSPDVLVDVPISAPAYHQINPILILSVPSSHLWG